MDDVVIVGASVAGVSVADSLRSAGFQGRIRLVDGEDAEPYDKPPLSKQALGVDGSAHRMALRKPGHFDEQGIELLLGRGAVALATGLSGPSLQLDDGETLAADAVVLATGARPRVLPPAAMLPGVHVVRTLADSRAIRSAFEAGPRVVVVGGGFIGLEVASSARARGLDVTVVELERQPLETLLGNEAAVAVTRMHADDGTRFVTGVGVAGVLGSDRVEQVRLTDRRKIDADLVVLGIGVAPAIDWLDGTGLQTTPGGGILCDAFGRTGVDGVYAAGDAASWADPVTGEPVHIEHWTTAQQHGVALGRTILDPGRPQLAPAVPYFWSDQCGVRLQSLGRPRGADEIVLAWGDWDTRDFVALYRRGDRLVGAVGANNARRLMPYRALIERNEPWDAAVSAFGASVRSPAVTLGSSA